MAVLGGDLGPFLGGILVLLAVLLSSAEHSLYKGNFHALMGAIWGLWRR